MRTVIDWFNDYFLPWYKPLSILFAGAFGILGLLKNFKEKKRDPETDTTVERVTIWGWISLIGIVLSTGLGIPAQQAEESIQGKKAAVAEDKVERLLSPTLEGIQFSTRYNLPCQKLALDCKDLRKRIKAQEKIAQVNREWALTVKFFLNQKDAESFIAGDEYTVGVLHTEGLPSIRIRPATEFYDYQAKYFRNDTQYHCPSGLDAAAEAELQAAALAAFRVTDCCGWGRVDFMRDPASGQFYFIEINTTPGMTDHSLVPMAARQSGIDFEELVWRVLETSFLRERK